MYAPSVHGSEARVILFMVLSRLMPGCWMKLMAYKLVVVLWVGGGVVAFLFLIFLLKLTYNYDDKGSRVLHI